MSVCVQGLQDTGVPVLNWEDFLFVGQTRPRQPVAPKPDDISTIMYTRCEVEAVAEAAAVAVCGQLFDTSTLAGSQCLCMEQRPVQLTCVSWPGSLVALCSG